MVQSTIVIMIEIIVRGMISMHMHVYVHTIIYINLHWPHVRIFQMSVERFQMSVESIYR